MSDYFAGSGWSQTYAKKAVPVLVNLAESHRATTYTELAKILLVSQKNFREFRISGRPVALGKIDENRHCFLGVRLRPARPSEVIAHIAFRSLLRATSAALAFAHGLIAR